MFANLSEYIYIYVRELSVCQNIYIYVYNMYIEDMSESMTRDMSG